MSVRFLAGSRNDDMRVTFVDPTGTTGTVTDGFEVNYNGRWENEIEDCVAAVQDDIRDAADREPPPEAVLQELPVTLFTDVPIRSVQTIDDTDDIPADGI